MHVVVPIVLGVLLAIPGLLCVVGVVRLGAALQRWERVVGVVSAAGSLGAGALLIGAAFVSSGLQLALGVAAFVVSTASVVAMRRVARGRLFGVEPS